MLDLGHYNKNVEKTYKTLIYEDKKNRVTWFSDISIEDVRFALCDYLVDGELRPLTIRLNQLIRIQLNFIWMHLFILLGERTILNRWIFY